MKMTLFNKRKWSHLRFFPSLAWFLRCLLHCTHTTDNTSKTGIHTHWTLNTQQHSQQSQLYGSFRFGWDSRVENSVNVGTKCYFNVMHLNDNMSRRASTLYTYIMVHVGFRRTPTTTKRERKKKKRKRARERSQSL